jgi:biotin carboxyl carrier protein
MKLVIEGREFDVQPSGDLVTVDGTDYSIRIVSHGDVATVYVNEKPLNVQLPNPRPEDGPITLLVDAKEYEVEVKGGVRAARSKRRDAARKSTASGVAGAITSQMTGQVVRVDVKEGDEVKEGDILLIIEAMKMENEIAAPMDGTVKELAVAAGARISEGDMLLVLEPAE